MRDRIMDAVAQLIVRYGLRKFTIDEIAASLRISKKTVYQYFPSKDDMIREYFETIIASDRQSVAEALNSGRDLRGKINAIVHSGHRYRMPVPVLQEAKTYYPDEWEKIEGLRQFKTEALHALLEQGKAENLLKPDVHFGVLSAMLDKVSGMFLDYDFLIENGLKTTQAIDEALSIIFHGILKES